MPATQSTDPADRADVRQGLATAEEKAPRVCLTAEFLEEHQPGKLHWVPCPELGDGMGVYIPTLTSKDRTAFEAENVKVKKKRVNGRRVTEREPNLEFINERLVIRFACDETGKRLWQPTNSSEERQICIVLQEKSASAINRISDKISELMGWSDLDLEDLAGN